MSSSSARFFRSLTPRRGLWSVVAAALLLLVIALNPQAAHSQTSPWTPVDFTISVGFYGSDNSSRILWKNANGQYALWKINSSGGVDKGIYLVPDTGYTAKQISIDYVGNTVVLWDNPTLKKIIFWHIDESMISINKGIAIKYPTSQYTPGYTLAATSSLDDINNVHLSWNLSDGHFLFWDVGYATGTVAHSSDLYGPYAGMKSGPFTINPPYQNASKISIVLTNATTNQAKVVVLPLAYGAVEHVFTYGPYSGATLQKIAAGGDAPLHLLWTYTSGKIALWNVGADDGVIKSSAVYGPISGVTPIGFGVDPADSTHIFWKYNTGKAALWTMAQPLTSIVAGYTYGPLK